jgi:hypothetical protein
VFKTFAIIFDFKENPKLKTRIHLFYLSSKVNFMRPSETFSFNRLIYIIFERKFDELGARYLKGRLIDIGCGGKTLQGYAIKIC